jgi:hypothetical protein
VSFARNQQERAGQAPHLVRPIAEAPAARGRKLLQPLDPQSRSCQRGHNIAERPLELGLGLLRRLTAREMAPAGIIEWLAARGDLVLADLGAQAFAWVDSFLNG